MHLCLDLDGTLVDSAPAIFASFERALAAHGLRPVVPLDRSLIGPPLRPTLARIAGHSDPELIERLATSFRATYDEDGVRATAPYDGLVETLASLRDAGHHLSVVTNKRLVPTRRLLDLLGVTAMFARIVTLDAVAPPHADKVASLGWLLRDVGVAPGEALMVGDSLEDARAAWANGVRLIAVAYGYGDAATQTEGPIAARLDRLRDLPGCVSALAR